MKIKILVFVNLVLIGTAIGLYLNRSTEARVAPAATSPAGSNTSPPLMDESKSNAVPNTAPQTRATGRNQFAAGIEKDFAPARSLF